MLIKTCTKCTQTLSTDMFYKQGKSFTSRCKKCFLEDQKLKRTIDPEAFRAKRRVNYSKNKEHILLKQKNAIANWSPEKRAAYNERRTKYQATKGYHKAVSRRRKYHLGRKYGLPIDQYNSLMELQNGCCAICKNPETKFNKRTNGFMSLCVDHCHITGKVRGLLCHNCNAGIGNLKDDIDRLYKAIDYLKLHQ